MLAAAPAGHALAGELVSVDASAPVAPPKEGYLILGSNRSPDGQVIAVNSRFLTLDGKPWMPVMGEVHYARIPPEEWDSLLAKVKASGVDIIATYVFWNYHEPTEGAFDWQGSKNLSSFLEAAQRHGLKVFLRIGPWAHAEVRFGGTPDWIVNATAPRSNDPVYMEHVARFWTELSSQVRGHLWKEGGPVIGIQLENEYNASGPGRGREHIAALKALALRLGFDTPLYTVTGWDNTIYPRREVMPVFGGYPDAPWYETLDQLPPFEVYAFRFASRANGELGAQTKSATRGDADGDIDNTPFIGAEFGTGIPTMYRRRPVIAPKDGAAIVPTQLGSGVNLYGYYMYSGGRNLVGQTTLEENAGIGGYNDLPLIDYDFQAPYGAYGEANAVAGYVRPFHYLMHSYGQALAGEVVRKPDQTPANERDLKTLRWSVRSNGDAGFLFVNNYVRGYAAAAHPDTRFRIRLPSGDLAFPDRPVTIPSGAYFIWPFDLDLGGATLSWATAQPVTRIDTGHGPLHVFAATDRIPADFAFPEGTRITGGAVRRSGKNLVARVLKPGTNAVLTIARPGAPAVRILVLSEEQSRKVWRVETPGQSRIVLTDDEVVNAAGSLSLASTGNPDFAFSVWPDLPASAKGSLPLSRGVPDGILTRYTARAVPRTISVAFTKVREAEAAPPLQVGGLANGPMAPRPELFGAKAAAWKIEVDAKDLAALDDAYLAFDWVGDSGRLFSGGQLLDDHYYDGRAWRIGLKRHAATLNKPLVLRIYPLRSDTPVYFQEGYKPDFGGKDQVADLRAIRVEARYRLNIAF